jgi:hypothetical protein
MTDIQPKDILLGRGPYCYMNPGNRIFRKVIRSYSTVYKRNTPRRVKKEIVESITRDLKTQGHRFLVHSECLGAWREASSSLVHAKIGHALRDARNNVVRVTKACVGSEPSQPPLPEYPKMSHTVGRESVSKIGNDIDNFGKRAVAADKDARKPMFLGKSHHQRLHNVNRNIHESIDNVESFEVYCQKTIERGFWNAHAFQR